MGEERDMRLIRVSEGIEIDSGDFTTKDRDWRQDLESKFKN